MYKIFKPTVFLLLTFISISAFGQQFIWSTNAKGSLLKSESKIISKEVVYQNLLSYYEAYEYYFDLTGFTKERYLKKFEASKSFNYINKTIWDNFKKTTNEINDSTITCLKTNEGSSSIILVFIFSKKNFDVIKFSNQIDQGAKNTFHSESISDKNRFIKFIEPLIGFARSNNLSFEKIHEEDNENKIWKEVEIPAEFPGGQQGWIRYLERTLNRDLPNKNGAPNGNYSVNVSFIVSKDGTLSEVKAENDPGFGTKDEAIRIIKNGPKWKPAVQNGRNVIYQMQIQIGFMVSKD
jgi:hypothetical protein